ncbi:ATP-binding protein [Nannocystis sp. ILAH1]|nr:MULTISPECIES: PAS domain-containing sensor histidine kinase [unclassified Nannocystis]MCY0989360.1 ATP-binding protein [Nannocystis sp. ILAH1]MCY1064945.1 ATP-binding protein [Nannocystis sp. RBIL2]
MSYHEPIFAMSLDPAVLLDSQGVVTRVNDSWQPTFGHSADELVGQALMGLLPPQEAEHLGRWLGDLAPDGRPRELHTRLRAGNGEYRLTHLRALRAPESGDVCLIARERWLDDAERDHLRQIGHRWDALVHCLPDFVVTSDLDGVVLTINREVPGIPTDQLVGRPESMFTPIAPDERPALRQRFAHVVQTGETLTYETQVLYPDNTYGTFESRLGPIFDGTRITGTVLVTRDLTRQRQAEEARRAAEQQIREYTIQLERSNRELERFASVASHDLQEPLRKIQAFGDRLRQKYAELLPEAGRDYVQRMQEAAKRMQDLINDLLMFSRLTTKEQRHAPVNLNKILTAVLSDLEVRIEENEAKIEAEGLPMLEADPMHMRQLFQNLISNAIKFRRPDHAPVVKITAEELPARGRATSMVMRVSDNGIGIDSKYHERIFGIFERLHSRGKYEGTGVGLAVCRKICEQHGGAIRVESNPDAGSTFIVELPLRQERKHQYP